MVVVSISHEVSMKRFQIYSPCQVAPRRGRPVIENVDKVTEIIKVYRHVSSRNIVQELQIDHKIVLGHLSKVRFKKKLDVWVTHQLTPKNMMDRISICEALAKRNEIDPFLKQMVAGDDKWIHTTILCKSNHGQSVVNKISPLFSPTDSSSNRHEVDLDSHTDLSRLTPTRCRPKAAYQRSDPAFTPTAAL
ncbi:histonelysine Nmethyltransferase SETMARlike [Trichonephila clavipes]|nr:histonelysine Nmethyltransferase SETMARlike [Trichonephila clavipes]